MCVCQPGRPRCAFAGQGVAERLEQHCRHRIDPDTVVALRDVEELRGAVLIVGAKVPVVTGVRGDRTAEVSGFSQRSPSVLRRSHASGEASVSTQFAGAIEARPSERGRDDGEDVRFFRGVRESERVPDEGDSAAWRRKWAQYRRFDSARFERRSGGGCAMRDPASRTPPSRVGARSTGPSRARPALRGLRRRGPLLG